MKAVLFLCVIGFIQTSFAGTSGRTYRDAPSETGQSLAESISTAIKAITSSITDTQNTEKAVSTLKGLSENLEKSLGDASTKIKDLVKGADPKVAEELKSLGKTIETSITNLRTRVAESNPQAGEILESIRTSLSDVRKKADENIKTFTDAAAPEFEKIKTQFDETLNTLSTESKKLIVDTQKALTP